MRRMVLRRVGARVASFGAVLVLLASISLSAPERVLDERRALYREDAEAQRPVAAVHAMVVADWNGVALRVEVSAVGDGVQPLPGVEGAPGANLRTAEELHFLLQDGALGFTTRQDRAARDGSVVATEYGPLPARRLGRGGVIESAATEAAWPLRLRFCSAPLPEGSARSYVTVRGVPRLCIETRRNGNRARIVAVESLGEERR